MAVPAIFVECDRPRVAAVPVSRERETVRSIRPGNSGRESQGPETRNSCVNSRSFALCRRNINGLPEFVQKHFGKISKVDRLGVYVLMHNILINDLRKRNIPVSIGSICRNLNRITETFNNEFPGYFESGMGKVILFAMKKGAYDGQ